MDDATKAKRFILVLGFLACAARAALVSAGEIDIDGFEDGTDAGWTVVGQGPLMRSYHKRLVSPGSDGTTFALRLTRNTKDGWCGLGIGHLGKLGLTSAAGVRLMARNAGGVQRILVDVHCRDGSRWWCKRPLSEDGQWTEARVAAEDFFVVNNPHHAKHPDLHTIERLWLTMDRLSPNPGDGKWLMDINSVAILGAARAFRKPAALQTPPVRWDGPRITVGITDADALPLLGQTPGLPKAIASLVDRVGCSAKLVVPGALKSVAESTRLDVLVLNGPGYVVGDVEAVIEHLKREKALWLISAAPIFSRPLELAGAGGWRDAPRARPNPVLNRILDAPRPGAPGGVQRPKHPLELVKPGFNLTDSARSWWPFLPAELPATKCSVLSVNDSTVRPCPPLLETHYVKRNWVQRKDNFTGWAMVMLSHHAGPFAGARILFSRLPNEARCILHPSHPAFAAVTVSCLRRLAMDTPCRTGISRAPLDGLPPPTRDNYLTYPGPVFMPIQFGGSAPVDDPTFWHDVELAGFNAILAAIAWRRKPDNAGSVIDWRPMDHIVSAARTHGCKVVCDPYTFNWDRFRGWAGNRSIHRRAWRTRFVRAMDELARRYADDQTVVALYATAHTDACSFKVDDNADGRAAWRRFVHKELRLSLRRARERYGMPVDSWDKLPLPRPTTDQPFNIGPLWADYLRFYNGAYHAFMRQVIESIRAEAPDMPLLLRGPYLEVAINMKLAAEFKNVAAHCECVETSADIEGYYRSLGLRFGVPISGENGWPKSRGGPSRMALADYLLGGYRDFQYSFGGPAWARPSIEDLHAAEKVARALRKARYPRANLALLVPDTTLWASRPPNFFSMERRPHLEFVMERLGFYFEGVSAQYPKLEGLRLIVDDGSNHVLTAACRDALGAWVRAGGTLVVFPHTGDYLLDGSKRGLAQALGLKFEARSPRSHETFSVGKGRVVALPTVPGEHDATSIDRFEQLLVELGAERDCEVRPRVNAACFKTEDKTYVVLYNKSRKYVAAFFRESVLPVVERSLPDLDR